MLLAHAMTSVTVFGRLGQPHSRCRESGLAAEIEAASVPAPVGVKQLLESGEDRSGGTSRNRARASEFTTFADGFKPWRKVLDATTSGAACGVSEPGSGLPSPGPW